MNRVENITQKILDDAKQAAKRNEQDAAVEAEKILNEYKARASKEAAEILTAAADETKKLEERMQSQERLDKRKQNLSVKREATVKAFHRAMDLLCHMPREHYIAFLCNLAVSAATGDFFVRLNQKDHDEVGLRLVEEINDTLSRHGKTFRAILSDKCVDMKGGVIISEGKIETNCSLEVIMDSYYNSLEKEVVQSLFSEGTDTTGRSQ